MVLDPERKLWRSIVYHRCGHDRNSEAMPPTTDPHKDEKWGRGYLGLYVGAQEKSRSSSTMANDAGRRCRSKFITEQDIPGLRSSFPSSKQTLCW